MFTAHLSITNSSGLFFNWMNEWVDKQMNNYNFKSHDVIWNTRRCEEGRWQSNYVNTCTTKLLIHITRTSDCQAQSKSKRWIFWKSVDRVHPRKGKWGVGEWFMVYFHSLLELVHPGSWVQGAVKTRPWETERGWGFKPINDTINFAFEKDYIGRYYGRQLDKNQQERQKLGDHIQSEWCHAKQKQTNKNREKGRGMNRFRQLCWKHTHTRMLKLCLKFACREH